MDFDEVKTETLDDNDIFLQEANAIARYLIQFEKSFYYLVFKTSEAELKVNDKAYTDQLPNDNKISNLISYYANNNNQGETFIPLTNFKEFSYKGKELEKIDQNEQINYKTIDLGNACFCIEVNNKNKIDEIQNQVISNFKEKGITVSAEIVPVYTATVKHSIFSDLNRKEFIEHLNIIIKQFGAIIIKHNKYVNNKNNKQSSDQGFIKVLMYSSFFTVPFARLIKNEFQQAIQYSILKIPRNVVDQFILTNNSVIKVLTSWFEEKNLQIKNKNNIWYGPENDVKKALQEFKVNPPKIPYNEYPIQGQFNLHQINDKVEAINKEIRKQVLNQIEPLDQKQKPKLKTKSTELLIDDKINLWKLNPRNRTLFIPNDTPEEQISNFFEQLNSLSDQTIVIDKFKLDEDEDEKNIDQILYDIDFHEDDSLRSRYLINIFLENGKLIQRNFCVDCIYETLQYNLGKIYDENDDCASYQDMYNSDQFIPIISFVPCKNVPNDKDPTFVQVFPIIPFGQIVWAFLNEPKIANIERTYITCLAVQSLFKSPKITHCPVHPSNLSIKPPIGSTQKCSIPNCKFQLCPICNKWHAVGECEEMIVPPGTRECPFCHQIVEKSQACNHIFCRCGHHFCYYCGEGFDDDQKTYAHMHHQKHWEEAPDYKKFIKNESVSDEDLQQFYEKYPKLKPKWNGY